LTSRRAAGRDEMEAVAEAIEALWGFEKKKFAAGNISPEQMCFGLLRFFCGVEGGIGRVGYI
jgi:hypothetical protein